MSLRIIVADDHPVVLIGTRSAVAASGIGVIVAVATNPSELFTALANHPCDVLVTDFTMPEAANPDGFPMLNRIRRLYPDLAIVLLSAATNVAILRSAAGLGVLGIVDKSATLEELPSAIQTVHRGMSYVSASHEKRAASAGHLKMRHKQTKALSPREAEVLRLLGSGLTVTQAAKRLNRGLTTISRQKRDAMRKLGLLNDSQLFDYLRAS